MKFVVFIIFTLGFLLSFGQSENDSVKLSTSIDTSLVAVDSSNLVLNDTTVKAVYDSILIYDSTIIVLDSVNSDTLAKEAKVFQEDTKLIIDSLENGKVQPIKVLNKNDVDTTKPYGVQFLKEFEMSGGTYHYLIMDAQHPEKLIRKPRWGSKKEFYEYEDLIVRLEIRGDKMNLYSIILSEQIIGALERLEKIHFVSDGKQILRVQEKGGYNSFFKKFEKMYLEGDESILKGKKFKNISSLVNYWNDYDPNKDEENTEEPTKYEVVD